MRTISEIKGTTERDTFLCTAATTVCGLATTRSKLATLACGLATMSCGLAILTCRLATTACQCTLHVDVVPSVGLYISTVLLIFKLLVYSYLLKKNTFQGGRVRMLW